GSSRSRILRCFHPPAPCPGLSGPRHCSFPFPPTVRAEWPRTRRSCTLAVFSSVHLSRKRERPGPPPSRAHLHKQMPSTILPSLILPSFFPPNKVAGAFARRPALPNVLFPRSSCAGTVLPKTGAVNRAELSRFGSERRREQALFETQGRGVRGL